MNQRRSDAGGLVVAVVSSEVVSRDYGSSRLAGKAVQNTEDNMRFRISHWPTESKVSGGGTDPRPHMLPIQSPFMEAPARSAPAWSPQLLFATADIVY